jgi:transposase
MDYIRGVERGQQVLLPDSVDEYVDIENPVRVINAYIDSLDLKALGFAQAEPHETGRPMYAPQDLLKLYIYGYMNRVRSSRRLEAETKRNLEVIWLMRKLTPDHKTIARFRQNNASALKNVFRDFVKLSLRLGLYGKELVAIDGSKFKAVNSKERNFTETKLKDRIERIEKKIEEYLAQIDATDKEENAVETNLSAEDMQKIVRELEERKSRYQTYMTELKTSGQTQKSLTDPDSRYMLANGKADICYNVQTSVDAKNKMIIEFNVTNQPFDCNQLSVMTGLSTELLEEKQMSFVADAGYDSARDIAECLKEGLDVHVAGTDYDICLPVDEEQGEEITSHVRGLGVYLPERNIVVCAMGKVMSPGGYKNSSGEAIYRNCKACSACACKCTVSQYKQFRISMPKDACTRDYDDKDFFVRQVRVKADKQLIKERKSIVEHPFGTVKRAMDAGYVLTKGFKNVRGEFSLTFLAYNLKRALHILGAKRIMEAVRV